MKHLFLIAYAALAALLAPQLVQAGNIKIYTFNGPSRRAAMTPPPSVPVADAREMKVGNIAWASANVDDSGKFAAKPDTLTKFYQWNRNKAWSAVTPTAEVPIPGWDVTEDGDAVWTATPCPTGWRLPTRAEYVALDGEGSTWAEANDSRGNAVAGRFFGENHVTCSLLGDMSGCVFFPAPGYRHLTDGRLIVAHPTAHLWSSTRVEDGGKAYSFFLDFEKTNPANEDSKAYAFHLRCVRDVP